MKLEIVWPDSFQLMSTVGPPSVASQQQGNSPFLVGKADGRAGGGSGVAKGRRAGEAEVTHG